MPFTAWQQSFLSDSVWGFLLPNLGLDLLFPILHIQCRFGLIQLDYWGFVRACGREGSLAAGPTEFRSREAVLGPVSTALH